jgi:hypothetical protein
MNGEIAIVDVVAEAEVPIWSVNNFLENVSSNYLKVISLREICIRFAAGAHDADFVIAGQSFDVFPKRHGPSYGKSALVPLEWKERSPDRFWQLFKRLQRPIVLAQRDREFSPIYDINSDQALQLKRLTLNSPLSFSFQGVPAVLIDLFTGRLLAQRDNERMSLAIQNVRQVVEISHLIESPNTPPGVKQYAIEQLEFIMNKQDRINGKLGIIPESIRLRRPE